MAKISCLNAMFFRKGKLKVTAADSLEDDNLCELTLKEPIMEGDSLITVADSASLDDKLTLAVGSIKNKLVSVPSIADWAKQEDNLCFSEPRDQLHAEPAATCPAEVFDFGIKDVGNTASVELDKNLGSHSLHVVDAFGEVAYEGGDEDDEIESAQGPKPSDSARYSEGTSISDLPRDEVQSGIAAEIGSATYFEFHSNVARVSDDGLGCLLDEEITGDYASDPGIHDNCNLGLGHSDKALAGCDFSCQSDDANFILKATRSEGGLSDMEFISQQDPGRLSRRDMVLVSQGSLSSVDVSSKAMSKYPMGSPCSEGALQDAVDLIASVSFSEDRTQVLKQKPWWKGFLITHRNIHREQKALAVSDSFCRSDMVLVSKPAGYSSDADHESGIPMFTSDVPQPDSGTVGLGSTIDKVVAPEGLKRSEQVTAKEADTIHTKVSEVVESLPYPSLSMLRLQSKGKEQKSFEFERPDLRRVEEWISNIDAIPFPAEEELENTTHSDTEPKSPPAPADSFFKKRAFPNDQVQPNGVSLLDRWEHHGDLTQDADTEMASLIAQSVNALSTVAHFSGVGLRHIPQLGVYSNLRTLNLSANAIVRIVPGSLPKSLHSLDLSRNKIAVIEGLRELSRLRILNLSYNRISRIGHGLANCTSIRELHLAGNRISEVEGLHRLLKVSYIDLSFNKLTSAKSIAQLAANYNSLQAINLLGNALHSNLGEEALRKLVSGLAPHVLYLNKQALKTISARDAAVDSVARAALASTNHHTHQRGKTSTHSKTLRRGGPSALPSGSLSYQGKGGDKVGLMSGGSRTSVSKSRAPLELASHHRHSHTTYGQGTGQSRISHLTHVSLVDNASLATENDAKSGILRAE